MAKKDYTGNRTDIGPIVRSVQCYFDEEGLEALEKIMDRERLRQYTVAIRRAVMAYARGVTK